MTLRRWEAVIVGVDQGEPYDDSLGRTFTRLGAQFKINQAIFPRGRSMETLARRSGWDITMRGEIRRVA